MANVLSTFYFHLHRSTSLCFYIIMPVVHLCHNVQSTSFLTSSFGGHFFSIFSIFRLVWVHLMNEFTAIFISEFGRLSPS